MAPVADYTPWFSRRARRRQPSAIRKLVPLTQLPGMISLAGGMPNPAMFPFNKITVDLRSNKSLTMEGPELTKCLQYSASYGMADLLQELKSLVVRTHRPPYEEGEMLHMTGTGSQDLLAKVFDMLLDEDSVLLCENPTYSGALASAAPIGCRTVGVSTDGDGIIPDDLERVINDNPAARVLYTIPTGQNPGGFTCSRERRGRVYEIACKHDLLLVEDDPYYYLYLDQDVTPQPPSYLSIDVEHRVLRLDSLSKVLSSGLRLGWMSGPKGLVERAQLDTQSTCMHASGLTQGVVTQILQHWGVDGWNAHVEAVQAFYRHRRDVFAALCDEHLKDLADWNVPSAGMFVWFNLRGVDDSEELISQKAVEQNVLMVPGAAFDPSGKPSGCVRAAFSIASEENLGEGVRRLAALLRAEQKSP